MSEQTNDATPDAEAPAEPETFTREYVEQLRKENAKYRTKAGEQTEAAKAAEKARLAAMSEAERAVAEAEARGRAAAAAAFGQKLARSTFLTEAARINPAFDAAAVADDVNLGKYLGEDGEPDSDGIAALAKRLIAAPEVNPRPVGDADLGTRTVPLALNGDGIELALRKKLGIT